jgi:THO complex subunit 2
MMDASSVSSPSYLVDLPKEFFQMLAACGPYLHRDTQLFQKVLLDLLMLIFSAFVPS